MARKTAKAPKEPEEEEMMMMMTKINLWSAPYTVTGICKYTRNCVFPIVTHKRADQRQKYAVKFNVLNPTGYVMHQQFNIQQLYVLPTLYLYVLYLSENKQRLVPLTA
jgi:hypothetical protein